MIPVCRYLVSRIQGRGKTIIFFFYVPTAVERSEGVWGANEVQGERRSPSLTLVKNPVGR